MEYHIVNYKGLARILCASEHTIKKTWRAIPHFFIGEGRNLKGARFNVPEVIEHLRKEANHVSLERSKKKNMGCEVPISEKTVQKGGLSNKVGSFRVGSRETQRIRKSSTAGTDPFNLLAGVDNVS
jgi:hypothetical protein